MAGLSRDPEGDGQECPCYDGQRQVCPCYGKERGPSRLALLPMLALLAVLAGGCGAEPPDSPAITEPDAVLRQMIQAYAGASSYADRGVVRLRYRAGGQWFQDEGRLAVRIQRPDRLMARLYQLTLASNGDRWQATIADAATRDMDGQVVVRPSPERLTLESLYEDPLILNVVAGGMGGPPAALELLLSDRPLEHLFSEDAHRELLEDAVLDGWTCHRVQVTLPEGPLVLWIDTETFVLRRLEYPTGPLAAQLDPDGRLQDLTLVAEMRDAVLNADLSAERFGFDLPAGAKAVRRFVLPPEPLATGLYGHLPDEFYFTDLDGQPVFRQQLLGRPAVLVWFNIHAASQACLEQLSEIREGFSGEEVAFLAVCTEPTTVGNRQLQRLAERWGVRLPVVRDLEAYGRDVFQIPGAPTVVVLDARGAVQAFKVGTRPELAETLTRLLRGVLQGADPASERLAEAQQQRQQYEQALSEVLQPLSQSALSSGSARR